MRQDLPLRDVLTVPSGRPDAEEMPLVIIMHGRGADAYDLADIAPMIDGADVPPRPLLHAAPALMSAKTTTAKPKR